MAPASATYTGDGLPPEQATHAPRTNEPIMEVELWLLWAALAAAMLLCYHHLANATLRRAPTGRTPPGPTPLPLVGNLLSLRGGNLHHTLARLARAHGPVMALRLGLTTAVFVSSRDAAREAFTRHDRRLAARAVPDAARALGFADRSVVWLPSYDPLWKTLRGVVAAHAFSPRALAAARAVRERKVRDLVGHLRRRAGTEVDVGHATYAGVLNLVSSALCSVDVVDMAAPESGQGVRELVEDLIAVIAKPNISDPVPFLRRLDLQGWRRWTAIRMEKIYRILDGIIDRRMEEKLSHGDFLGSLLELVSAGKIGRENLAVILFDLFTAGSDTMSITVEWAMAELLKNPSVMAKLRAEIDGALGGKEAIGETDAAGLTYLQAVVKEAMRLHPAAPILLPHRAEEDGVEIGGYAVPKGSTIIFNVWAMMRDPAVWERPDEFVPERFLAMSTEEQAVDFRGKAFEFIPLGSGRRVCPGVPMAERVVPLVLASLLHAFEWRLPDGVSAAELDVSERFTTANVMAVPLKAVPVVVTQLMDVTT